MGHGIDPTIPGTATSQQNDNKPLSHGRRLCLCGVRNSISDIIFRRGRTLLENTSVTDFPRVTKVGLVGLDGTRNFPRVSVARMILDTGTIPTAPLAVEDRWRQPEVPVTKVSLLDTVLRAPT
jgi:hypothetical protein